MCWSRGAGKGTGLYVQQNSSTAMQQYCRRTMSSLFTQKKQRVQRRRSRLGLSSCSRCSMAASSLQERKGQQCASGASCLGQAALS
jgi:hypothetical protein